MWAEPEKGIVKTPFGHLKIVFYNFLVLFYLIWSGHVNFGDSGVLTFALSVASRFCENWFFFSTMVLKYDGRLHNLEVEMYNHFIKFMKI